MAIGEIVDLPENYALSSVDRSVLLLILIVG